jgi:acetylornithine deacetylase/succinyl-diaminopimelate desuccinylase-like protein
VDKRLRQETDKISGDVIRLTRDLVRTPSPSLHEKDVAAKVADAMHQLHYDLVFTDDLGNVVGVIVGSDPYSAILMCSHMDTEKTDRFEGWNRSPFSGDIVGGRIEGVGSADCKGGLAAQIFAGQVVAANHLVSKSSVVVAATVADEEGCGIGIRHLLKTTLPELGKSARFVVLGEPTALTIGTGHDGWMGVDIDLFSSVWGAAQSAAEHVFLTLSSHCDEPDVLESPAIMTVHQPRTGRSDHGFLETIRLYRRLLPGEEAEDVLGWLEREIFEGTREIHAVFLEARVHQEEQMLYTGHRRMVRLAVPPWSTNLMHPLVNRARDSMLAAGFRWNPRAWKPGRVGTGTAGGVVSREFGIPVLGHGPGEEEQAHARNESVSLHSLIGAVVGTATLMSGLSAAPVEAATGMTQTDEERFTTSVG